MWRSCKLRQDTWTFRRDGHKQLPQSHVTSTCPDSGISEVLFTIIVFQVIINLYRLPHFAIRRSADIHCI